MKKGLSKSDLKKLTKTFARLNKEQEAIEAAAPEVVAIKVTYAEDAPKQPDGTFEILFFTREKADQYMAEPHRHNLEMISFAEGVELASQNDCCGGSFALKDAKRFQRINPFVQSLDLKIG